ncbi:MAG: EamA family transporter [Hyphomicrobiales bacterium]|nr:EamA family transporter [Hyphomicrobiales bacterium]
MRAQGPATLAGFGAILLWSALAVLTTATGDVPPFQLTAITFATGGLAGLAVLLWRGETGVLRQRPAVWALGVGGLFLYHALYFAALRSAPPAEAGLVNYLWPLLIVLFSALLPGETLRLRHIVGALTGFAGLVVLFVGKGEGFSALSAGYGLAFAAAFVWAGYSVASRRFAAVPSGAVAGFCLATAALAGVLHVATERTVWPQDAGQWAALALLGLGPAGAAFFLWDHGVKRGDIRLIGVLSYAAPVLSTLWLVAAGRAEAGWPLAAACAMIVVGAAVASR